jgi:hypothetical protein
MHVPLVLGTHLDEIFPFCLQSVKFGLHAHRREESCASVVGHPQQVSPHPLLDQFGLTGSESPEEKVPHYGDHFSDSLLAQLPHCLPCTQFLHVTEDLFATRLPKLPLILFGPEARLCVQPVCVFHRRAAQHVVFPHLLSAVLRDVDFTGIFMVVYRYFRHRYRLVLRVHKTAQ